MLINDWGCFKMFAEMVPFGHSPTVVWRVHQERGRVKNGQKRVAIYVQSDRTLIKS